MRIHLFIPCFVDQLAPEVAWSTARVLERLGHQVVVPPTPACCGQPAFNSGFHEEGMRVARAWLRVYADAEAIVAPSGSCVAQVRRHYPVLFGTSAEADHASALAHRTFELSQFLVDVLRQVDVGARWDGVASFHDGCHGMRELGIGPQPRQLLARVDGLQVIEPARNDLCCGFGGTFSVKLPELSVAMADARLATFANAAGSHPLQWLISGETMCLSQLGGRLRGGGAIEPLRRVRTVHLAEVLAGQDDTHGGRSV